MDIGAFKRTKILVIGDVMLDRYLWGVVTRISPEAPVPIVKLSGKSVSPGGAANVAANVSALGANVVLVGCIDGELESGELKGALGSAGVGSKNLVVSDTRPISVKTRIMAHAQQMIRLDSESTEPMTSYDAESVLGRFSATVADVDLVIVSDYGKGVISQQISSRIINEAKIIGKPVLVDPKGKDFRKYSGATILTPNRREAAEACRIDETYPVIIDAAARQLLDELSLEHLLITESENGMTLFDAKGNRHHFDAAAKQVYDVTGAGDSVIACLGVALAAGFDPVTAARLANIAGGLSVQKLGQHQCLLENWLMLFRRYQSNLRDARHQMKLSVNFVERRDPSTLSIERVFRRLAEEFEECDIKTSFQSVPGGNGLAGTLRNLLTFTPLASDIFHITGHINYTALILPVDRTVITFHDLTLLAYRKGIRRWILKKLYFDWPARRVRYITAISEATKSELCRLSSIDPAKVTVIENPLLVEIEKGSLAASFNEDKPTILQIGTAENKNLRALVQAIQPLKVGLRIVGRLEKKTLKKLSNDFEYFRNDEELVDDDLLDAYKQSDIVVFCSTKEGFGLPIIEAQALGKPVITSDISPMREVAGDGALLADPMDPQSIRECLLRVINDVELRSQLIENGYKNVLRFCPKAIASQYLSLYERIKNEGQIDLK